MASQVYCCQAHIGPFKLRIETRDLQIAIARLVEAALAEISVGASKALLAVLGYRMERQLGIEDDGGGRGVRRHICCFDFIKNHHRLI